LYTDVAGFQVRLEFSGARPRLVQFSVWNAYRARRLRGTAPVDLRQDVRLAADVAEVFTHARPEPHPTVPGRCHDNDAVVPAARLEVVRFAVVAVL